MLIKVVPGVQIAIILTLMLKYFARLYTNNLSETLPRLINNLVSRSSTVELF